MRIGISTRTGYSVEELGNLIEKFSNLSYESAMPGGMTTANFRIPWQSSYYPDLNGCSVNITDGTKTTWWGRIVSTTDVIESEEHYLDVVANGPWSLMAQRPFTQDYSASEVGWTPNKIITAAVFGNVEDISINDDDWSAAGVNINPISWSDSNVQTVVGDCLRLGDDTTAPWTFLVYPPKFQPSQDDFYYYTHTCETTTGLTLSSSARCSLTNEQYRHGNYSIKMNALASGTATVSKALTSTCGTFYVSAWFYIPNGEPAVEHDLITLDDSGGTAIARLTADEDNDLYIWSIHTGSAYNAYGSMKLGTGCWHWFRMYLDTALVGGTLRVMMDGTNIISSSGVDTNNDELKTAVFGLDRSAASARTVYIDDIVLNKGSIGFGEDCLVSETLPRAKLVTFGSAGASFVLDISDVGDSYSFDRSLNGVVNQLDVTYGTGGSSIAPQIDTDSVTKYGQLHGKQSVAKITSATIAGYVQDRYLEQYKEPFPQPRTITLRKPPISSTGVKIPLSEIFAGMSFTIRQRQDLGTFYVGHTRYIYGGEGQEELCEITPTGVPTTLDVEIIKRRMRTWT